MKILLNNSFLTKSKIALLIIFIFFSSAYNLLAQKAEAILQKDTIYIGEQIELKLNFQIPSNSKNIQFPELGKDTLTNFITVINESAIDTLKVNETLIEYSKTYLITSFDSGKHYLPAIKFMYQHNNDTIYFNYFNENLGLYVKLLDTEYNAEIKDIKQRWNLPFYWKAYIYHIIIGLGMLLLILGLIYYFMRNKKKSLFFPENLASLAPDIEAINKLNYIKESKIWTKGQVKEYYTLLTDTLRHFIERKFNIPSLEYTSSETINAIKDCDIENQELEDLKSILFLADMVKFAKNVPSNYDCEKSLDLSYSFVVNTCKHLETKEKSIIEESNSGGANNDLDTK